MAEIYRRRLCEKQNTNEEKTDTRQAPLWSKKEKYKT